MEDIIYVPLVKNVGELGQKLIKQFVSEGWQRRGLVELTDAFKHTIVVQVLARPIK